VSQGLATGKQSAAAAAAAAAAGHAARDEGEEAKQEQVQKLMQSSNSDASGLRISIGTSPRKRGIAQRAATAGVAVRSREVNGAPNEGMGFVVGYRSNK
jgi:hypothetical protein